MAERKNKPIYQSGELDRTRKNIGNIDPKEARRMASLLGGEIGIEKDSAAVRQGYEKISSLKRRKSDPARSSGGKSSGSDEHPKNGGTAPVNLKENTKKSHALGKSSGSRGTNTSPAPLVIDSSRKSGSVRKNRKNYWVRIRTNFLAAKREHNIKTLASALSSILPFNTESDEINPRFIIDLEKKLYEPILQIQKGASLLLAGGTRRNSNGYRPDPFYKAVLEILSEWDIKTIGQELARLEKISKKLTAGSCTKLCRALFIPIIRLQNLEESSHITNSVRHFYELNLKIGKSDEPKKIALMKKKSLEVMNLYPLIFRRIHYGYYPLLMNLSCSSFSQYDEFYSSCTLEYLGFLLLDASSILMPPTEIPPVSPEENSQIQTEWEPPKKEEEPIPMEFTHGLRLLQGMFPQSGFEDMAQHPDFYPYFQPIFDLPRNFELLPADDPLQGITIIILFLKELFFAFGSIQFTSIKTEEWDLPEIRSVFEEYTAGWYAFLENFLPKLLLIPLLEYCRGIEKSNDFSASAYGVKLESKIFWLKKSYCLPHLKVVKSIHGKPPERGKITRIYHLTEDLYSLFLAILNNENADPGIKNLEDPIHFEVPTMISRRFIATLKRKGLEGTNRDLISATASLLCLLNQLLNKASSFYYKSTPDPIYRCEPGNKYNPVYSVTPVETEKIMKGADRRIEEASCGDNDNTNGEVHPCTREELEKVIADELENKGAEGTILLHINISEPVTDSPMEPVLENTLRIGPDRWYRISNEEWLIILPETPPEGGVRLTTRLLNQLMPLYGSQIGIYAGLTPLEAEWTASKALYISDNTLKESKKRNGEVVVLYTPSEKKYRLYTIKSSKKAEEKKDESLS
ncbi:MAG: hypothetical protein JEY99_12900 [Spirochaetales bacterium]|nr:hypothetical protein [Spirochaetales bacterium]